MAAVLHEGGEVAQRRADFHGGELAGAVLIGERHAGQAVKLRAQARVKHRAEALVADGAARGDDHAAVRLDVDRLLRGLDIALGEQAGQRLRLIRQDRRRIGRLHAQHAAGEGVLAVDLVHVVVEQEAGALLAQRALERTGDAQTGVAPAGIDVLPALGGGVGVGPARDALRLGEAIQHVVAAGGLLVLYDQTLGDAEVIALGHAVGDGADIIAVVEAGGQRHAAGVVDIVLIGGVHDAVLLLGDGAAAGVQVAAADRAVAAHVPVGLHQQDGRAVLHGLERSGQTRAARADDDDVGLIIPLDAGRILGDRCIRAEDARGGQTSRA